MAKVDVTVKLYGLLCSYGVPRNLSLSAQSVQDVIRELSELGVDSKLLRGTLIFINDHPVTGAMQSRRRLKPGDIIALLSPAGGG